VVVIFKP